MLAARKDSYYATHRLKKLNRDLENNPTSQALKEAIAKFKTEEEKNDGLAQKYEAEVKEKYNERMRLRSSGEILKAMIPILKSAVEPLSIYNLQDYKKEKDSKEEVQTPRPSPGKRK
jgi:hypothetical protein